METYLATDQPEECPKCGSRTDWDIVLDGVKEVQHHICLKEDCRYEYWVEEDQDFLDHWDSQTDES